MNNLHDKADKKFLMFEFVEPMVVSAPYVTGITIDPVMDDTIILMNESYKLVSLFVAYNAFNVDPEVKLPAVAVSVS
jgi:hypothetical protein